MRNDLTYSDFEFTLPVVYNKLAFDSTLNHLREHSDILSSKDIELVLSSNDFMRRKTFQILFNKFNDFKSVYGDIFYWTVVGLN